MQRKPSVTGAGAKGMLADILLRQSSTNNVSIVKMANTISRTWRAVSHPTNFATHLSEHAGNTGPKLCDYMEDVARKYGVTERGMTKADTTHD